MILRSANVSISNASEQDVDNPAEEGCSLCRTVGRVHCKIGGLVIDEHQVRMIALISRERNTSWPDMVVQNGKCGAVWGEAGHGTPHLNCLSARGHFFMAVQV